MAITETKCPGCGRKTNLGTAHCKYPSNPTVNAQFPVKTFPLERGKVQVERRTRAHAIRSQNEGR